MLAPGTVIHDRYRIVRQIGQGGMGAVYEAIDLRLNNTVALKQMLLSGEPLRRAFDHEARVLAGLRHPGLPKVFDHFAQDQAQFLVMEFIPGQDLGALLEQHVGPFAPEQVLIWADQCLAVLDYLHNQQPPIIHRDIKPQNLKLTPDGQLILLDFGLSKGLNNPTNSYALTTERSLFAFTLQYAPPEQIQGSRTNARSDLYALAATLRVLLTGEPPINAMMRASHLAMQQPDPQPVAHMICPAVPPALSAVLFQAMALNPADRPATAKAMRTALKAVTANAGPGVPTAPPPTPGPSRWRWPVLGIGAALLLVVGVALGSARSTVTSDEPTPTLVQLSPTLEVPVPLVVATESGLRTPERVVEPTPVVLPTREPLTATPLPLSPTALPSLAVPTNRPTQVPNRPTQTMALPSPSPSVQATLATSPLLPTNPPPVPASLTPVVPTLAPAASTIGADERPQPVPPTEVPPTVVTPTDVPPGSGYPLPTVVLPTMLPTEVPIPTAEVLPTPVPIPTTITMPTDVPTAYP